MTLFYKNKPKTEKDYLKQVSLLFGRSEIDRAITILEKACHELPEASMILKVLGKLYMKVGAPEKAVKCFQSVLNPKVNNLKNHDYIPNSMDVKYLEERRADLYEEEYTFLPTAVPQFLRKIKVTLPSILTRFRRITFQQAKYVSFFKKI